MADYNAGPREYSGTRLYLGNLPKDTRKDEIQDFFNEYGHGTITEIKLMDGFGFIQYDSEADAKDVVPAFHGKEFKGQSLIVQFARGNRHNPRETFAPGPGFPRPRRTGFRMQISGLPPDTSWQDLKDFARKSNDNVVYSDMSRDRDGRGTVEFETLDDLMRAVKFLDGSDYKGYNVSCVADVRDDVPDTGYGGGSGPRGPPRGRSVSPPPYRGGGRGGYNRYSPPGGRHHSPPRYGGGSRSNRYESPPYRSGGGGGGGYRERSPPPPRGGGREPYYGGGRDRSPPPPRRAMPPVDDYPPRSAGYGGGREDPYPARGGYDDDVSYRGHRVNGSGRSSRYDETSRRLPPSPPPPHGGRSPPPIRGGPPPPRGGYDDYENRPRRY